MIRTKMFNAVEYLIFNVFNEARVDEFIELDHEYWTLYLKDKPGFISKEIFISKTNPNEVHSLIYWESLALWKAIDVEELVSIDQKFTEAFGYNEFKIIGEVHNDNALFKVSDYR